MKKILLLLLLTNALSFAQTRNKKCKKCNQEKVSQDYLNPYSNDTAKKNTIIRNRIEFLGENLEETIPPIASNANIITLKFDGSGSIYPYFVESNFKQIFEFYNEVNPTYIHNNTFYGLRYGHEEKESTNLKRFYDLTPPSQRDKLETIFSKYSSGEKIEYLKFTKDWNKEYLPYFSEKIQDLIQNKSIEKIVMICHGYNLPYSLAQIQSNNIINLYSQESKIPVDKILFIKVFYPSLNNKTYYFNELNMSFRNDIKMKTIPYFSYVTNRAFNVGLSLRKTLNSFEFNGKIDVLAHSMGCVVTSAMLVNPTSKMDLSNKTNDNYYNLLLADEFKNEKIPKKTINLFLNAPAMPGPGTFNDEVLNDPNHVNYQWTIGYNNRDKVLKKKILVFRFPESNGVTRLGANDRREVKKTEKELKAIELVKGKFTFVETGVQKDLFGHDFFCYLQQPNFQKEFKKFINQ